MASFALGVTKRRCIFVYFAALSCVALGILIPQWSLFAIGGFCIHPDLIYSVISVNTRSSLLSPHVGKSTSCLRGYKLVMNVVSKSLKSPQIRNRADLRLLIWLEIVLMM